MVSVIVPIFNKEKELARCIDSVLNQTFSDLEIILVNDGSSDNSLGICEDYEKRYENIVVIDKENGGVSTARNAGMEKANGEWIMFADPDDVLFPLTVEELYKYSGYGADVIAACLCTSAELSNYYYEIDFSSILLSAPKMSFYDGNRVFFDGDYLMNQSLKRFKKKELFLELFNDNYGAKHPRLNGIGSPCVKLYKTDFIRKNNFHFFTDLKRMQDNIFNMYVFERATAVIYIDEPLYIYDITHKLGFQRQYDPATIVYYDKVLHYRWDVCKKNNYTKDEYLEEYTAGAHSIINAMLKHYFLNSDNDKSRTEKIREMETFFSDEFYADTIRNHRHGKMSFFMGIRILLLRMKQYDLLLLMEKAIVRVKGR